MSEEEASSDSRRSGEGGKPKPRSDTPGKRTAGQHVLRYILAFGSIAKGVIYVALGAIALNVAVRGSGEPESVEGTLLEIGAKPFGNAALIALFLGLLHYAVWRLTQALLDPERLSTEPYGRWMRIWSGLIGAIHLAVAYQVMTEILWGWGLSENGGSGEEVQSWTSVVLSWPAGRWLVGAAGVTAFVICVGQLIFAYRAIFANAFDMRRTGKRARRIMIWLGRIGFGARAVVAAVIGLFFFAATLTEDPTEAGGVAEALQTLLKQPLGPWFLGAVALGLIAFGLFFWGLSRYQAVDQESKPALDD